MTDHNQDVLSAGRQNGAQEQTEAPSLDSVYQQIMRDKQQQQQQQQQAAASGRTDFPLQPNLYGNGLQQPGCNIPQPGQTLLALPAVPISQPSSLRHSMKRSSTLQGLYNSLSRAGGSFGSLSPLLWSSNLSEQRLLECLAADMQEIAAHAPNVEALRRTFTIERMVSGGEGDLHALLAGHINDIAPAPSSVVNALVQASLQDAQQQEQHQSTQPQTTSAGAVQPPGSQQECNAIIQDGSVNGLQASIPAAASGDVQQHTNQDSHVRVGEVVQDTVEGQLIKQDQAASTQNQQVVNAPVTEALSRQGSAATSKTQVQQELQALEHCNAVLYEQVEALLESIDRMQQENGRMKAAVLQTCHARGIPASMPQLNHTIASQRSQPMSDDKAVEIAISAFAENGGDYAATVRHLVQSALTNAHNYNNGSRAGAMSASQPPKQQQHGVKSEGIAYLPQTSLDDAMKNQQLAAGVQWAPNQAMLPNAATGSNSSSYGIQHVIMPVHDNSSVSNVQGIGVTGNHVTMFDGRAATPAGQTYGGPVLMQLQPHQAMNVNVHATGHEQSIQHLQNHPTANATFVMNGSMGNTSYYQPLVTGPAGLPQALNVLQQVMPQQLHISHIPQQWQSAGMRASDPVAVMNGPVLGSIDLSGLLGTMHTPLQTTQL